MIQRPIAVAAAAFAISVSAFAAQPQADRNAIRAHLSFLADDALEGREAGTRGYDIAAAYVAAQFAQYGLAPKGDGGTYVQRVPLRTSRIQPGTAKVELVTPDGASAFGPADVILVDSALPDQASGSAPVVFAGYGIRAPRFGHDDFKGLDLRGKIVAVLQGKPGSFPSEEGAHFGSRDEKLALVKSLGAVGLAVLYTPEAEKRATFAKLVERSDHPQMDWVNKEGRPGSAVDGMQDVVVLGAPAGRKLFQRSGVSLDEVFARAAAGKPVAPVDLKVSLRTSRSSQRLDATSANVIGMIEGSDARLKHEYVVISAHLDGLGVRKERSGDNIYNGAMDNASGVAVMLEAARMFTRDGPRPKRSILFVALTAEEKGLLGADYFASNPTVPRGSIVANVNLDMPMLSYDFNRVIAFGADHSTLGEPVARAARAAGVALQPDPWPEQGIFTRSDHYMFVRQGIPSVMIATGLGSFKKEEDAAQVWQRFFATHYHEPSDDLALPFNWDAAVRFAEVNYQIALAIADAPERPSWKKGDFFGETFSTSR